MIATAILISPSLSYALTTETIVTPDNIRQVGHGVAVNVTKHADNTFTFSVSMACNEGQLALLTSHISDGSTTFAHSSCPVFPFGGRATAKVTVPERLLSTSAIKFSFVRWRFTGAGERALISGSNAYYISLVDFSSQATTISPAPKKPSITPPPPVIVESVLEADG